MVKGCYSSDSIALGASESITFNVSQYENHINTNELCSMQCSRHLYLFSATSNSAACHCSNRIYGQTLDSSQCLSACSGNATDYCGGAQTYSIAKTSFNCRCTWEEALFLTNFLTLLSRPSRFEPSCSGAENKSFVRCHSWLHACAKAICSDASCQRLLKHAHQPGLRGKLCNCRLKY